MRPFASGGLPCLINTTREKFIFFGGGEVIHTHHSSDSNQAGYLALCNRRIVFLQSI